MSLLNNPSSRRSLDDHFLRKSFCCFYYECLRVIQDKLMTHFLDRKTFVVVAVKATAKSSRRRQDLIRVWPCPSMAVVSTWLRLTFGNVGLPASKFLEQGQKTA